MAADTTLTTATASVQASPTAKTKLSNVRATPQSTMAADTYTIADALEVGDKIRVRKVQGGSEILMVLGGVIELSTATALTLDLGIYKVAADGSLGDAVDSDILMDGVNVAGGSLVTQAGAAYAVPTDENEYWIVAEVMAITGTTVADETLEFFIPINSAN